MDYQAISLRDTAFRANTERFQELVPENALLPHLCPLSVPKGGGMWGILGKPFKRAIWNSLGLHAVFTTCLRFSSVLDGCVLPAASFCQQAATMSVYKSRQCAVPSPDAPHKPLVRKRARSGGAEWVRVTRRPAKPAQKPRVVGLQQPACTHEEHQILSTAEATAFATQFWDRKVHPNKAVQHEFLATCIDVDLEQKVKHAGRQKYTRKRGHQTTNFVPYRGFAQGPTDQTAKCGPHKLTASGPCP